MIRYAICIALLVLTLGIDAFAVDVTPVLNAEQQKIAQEVHEIFADKCLDCHGPELPRPKGKFGYVLDLERVADNSDYVIRGNPDKSEIYQMVLDDEMPGDDAKVPPLSLDQKKVVKRWIELGAPATPFKAFEPKSAAAETSEIALPFWKRAIRWVGRFHPVSTHFPVALMFVAVLAEGFAWRTKREFWLQTVRFLVIIGALGAVVAAGLGWVNASFASYVGSSAAILKWHRWLGTFTAVWTTVCAGLVVISECREGSAERRRFRGALLLGAAMVGISGFLGSALIYGLDHYRW
jgi:uncharacterized membrane protein